MVLTQISFRYFAGADRKFRKIFAKLPHKALPQFMCPHYPIQPTIRHTPYTGSVCPSASDTPCSLPLSLSSLHGRRHAPPASPHPRGGSPILNQSGACCSAAPALPARNLSGYASAAHQTCSSIAQRHAHMMPNWVRMRIRSLLHLPTPRWRCRRCGATTPERRRKRLQHQKY